MSESSSAKPHRLNGASASNQLNFHQLYLFYTVASHHSFSKAAQALAITQPAVSIQIQELEKSMGVTLFHRRPKGLRVTDAGETVYAYAQQIFALSGKLLETLQEAQDLKTGHLVLGASTTPGEYVLPQAVGQFRRLYPGIQLELIIANTRSIVQRILSGEIDLGMVGERPQQHSGELEIIDYMEDEIVLVAAPNHPMAQLSSLSAQQVVDEGLIVREVGSATRQTAERHLESLGAFPRVALELGSNEAVKQAAAAGGGIGVVSRLGVTAEVKAGMLTVLKVEGWNCRRPLTLVYPKDRYLSPAQRAFRSFLIDRKPVSG